MLDEPIKEIAFSDYPVTLQNMHNPPKRLWMRGKWPKLSDEHRFLCVIGSRRWTPYGRDAVNRIVSGLRGYPVSIVSGLAVGIDSIAHMAALEAGLHCIAFPGSTLEWDEIYPAAHQWLAKKIVGNGGALLSRWSIDCPMGKWAFPARNVLMAGLSHAVLIVEAGQHSGSLMTAEHAEQFNREVMAVPGSIFASNSYGPNMLIGKGSYPVASAEDVLKVLGLSVSRMDKTVHSRLAGLDELSRKIIETLSFEEMTADRLAEKLGKAAAEINQKLSLLELEGFVSIDETSIKALL